MSKIAPSILAGNTLRLGEAARRIVDAQCDALHLDIMDGVFVPNLSFGPGTLTDLKREIDAYYDVHLMLIDPLPYIEVFAKCGADRLTVHVEARHFKESLHRIHECGCKAGASLKPGTAVTALKPYLSLLDSVLLMTVEPGFGGQKLMPGVLQKAAELRALGYAGEIEADGGITPENAPLLAQAGVDMLVMGTGFFKAEDPAALARQIHALHA